MKASDILEKYTDYILEEGKRPLNVYKFCKQIDIEENEFYNHFGSFDAAEKFVFSHFFDETFALISKNTDFQNGTSKEKLLSFYYTYLEILNANRSLVLHLLDAKQPLKGLKNLQGLKEKFLVFIDGLELKKLELPIEQLEELQGKGMGEAIWGQFLLILKYWMEDDSPGFEKTDVFIEKSTKVGFDLMNVSQLESIIDFGKFLFKDKMKSI